LIWKRNAAETGEAQRTLAWLAGVLMLCGAMIPSPVGRAGVSGLGAVVALAPLTFGSGKLKLVGLAVLLVALWLVVDAYPAAREEMNRHAAHARKS